MNRERIVRRLKGQWLHLWLQSLFGGSEHICACLAAIGDNPRSQTVWRVSVVVTSVARLCIALLYRNLFIRNSFSLQYIQNIINVAFSTNLMELLSLNLLSFVDSDQHVRLSSQVHKAAFATFLLSSSVYFILQIFLLRYH